ncbi:MAG: DUF308 domain-containing protein [Clostridiales bacterium]|nr:DUF308 domain-containing protein [Clostridiales bacterium]
MNLRSAKTQSILVDIVLILLGAVFIVFNQFIASMFVQVIGGVMILLGVIGIIVFFVRKEKTIGSGFMVAGAVAGILIGLFFLLRSDVVVSAFNYIFGSIMIMAGLVVLITSIGNARRVGRGWWITSLFGLAAAILGGIVLFAEIGDNVISILTGIALILCGIAGIIETIRLAKALDQMSKRDFTPPPGDRVGPV